MSGSGAFRVRAGLSKPSVIVFHQGCADPHQKEKPQPIEIAAGLEY
jgi:hypothetical protein